MQIFDNIKKTEYNTVVALGFFDGVHLGHQSVIRACKNYADSKLKTAILTFKNSPAEILSDTKKPLITTIKQKAALFEQAGIDSAYFIDFKDVQNLSGESFVRDILADKLNAKIVVTGFNYHFGKGGKENADDLCKLCEKYAIKTYVCDPVMYDDAPVSSTRIRECIKSGEVDKANSMLGYDFSFEAEIISGNHIGSKINLPTINQPLIPQLVVPKFGVYASLVSINNKTYIGATNIGVHPTVAQTTPLCETHLIDYNGKDLYGASAKIKLLKFIREERKFDSIEQLRIQIENDKQDIITLLKH